ncbi:MAG: hypothetical protein ACREQY_16625, partial [Candidatus Binatia bacterium]
MRISGFSFVRNGLSLYYPVLESVRSILSICDEFVVAVGRGWEGDATRQAIAAIGDPRIRILDTVWEEHHFRRGTVNAIQTDIARAACTGDWLFYLQADEVVHERYLDRVALRCNDLIAVPEVEGLLFRFKHFWGDYDHYVESHAWYPYEIRIIRNRPEIRSWHSAQSFRWYERYEHPWQEGATRKLNVATIEADIYHYGWVRPPRLMQAKNKALNVVHAGAAAAEARYAALPEDFDYGDRSLLSRFTGTHPAVMADRVRRMDWDAWSARLPGRTRLRPKHARLKYRALTFVERTLFGGQPVFGNRNYRVIAGRGVRS